MARIEPVIGMEVVPGQMRLVEMTSSAAGQEVTNFAIVDLPPGGVRLVGPRLRNALKEQGFRAKIINAIIPYPSIEHRQASLPPMSKSDLKLAAGREARKDIKFPVEELVADYEVVGEYEEKGLRRIELLLTMAQSRDIDDLFSMAKEFGLKFNSLTVAPVALLNLLRMKGGIRDEVLAMVHVGTDKGTIILLHQGNLRLSREFPIKPGAEFTELAGRLVGEIKRSQLFIRHRARGVMINKVLILGEIIQPNELANTINSETEIQTEVYTPMGLDLSPLGDRVHEFRESLSKLSISLGLAWSGPECSKLNLLSQQLAAQKKLALAKVAIISTGVLLTLLLTANYFLLWQKAGPYEEDYARLRQELAALRPQIQELKEMQKERDLLDTRFAFLHKMRGPSTQWSDILRTLSLSVPDELLVHSIEIKEANVGWILKISGVVIGTDAALVQKEFNKFFSLFLTCPALSEGEIESLTIGPLTGARIREASKLEFTVACKLTG